MNKILLTLLLAVLLVAGCQEEKKVDIDDSLTITFSDDVKFTYKEPELTMELLKEEIVKLEKQVEQYHCEHKWRFIGIETNWGGSWEATFKCRYCDKKVSRTYDEWPKTYPKPKD